MRFLELSDQLYPNDAVCTVDPHPVRSECALDGTLLHLKGLHAVYLVVNLPKRHGDIPEVVTCPHRCDAARSANTLEKQCKLLIRRAIDAGACWQLAFYAQLAAVHILIPTEDLPAMAPARLSVALAAIEESQAALIGGLCA